MRAARGSAPEPLRVVIVCANADTRDDLVAYLREAGVVAHGIATLKVAAAAGAPSAFVFFPDEFRTSSVLRAVTRLQRARPRVLAVIVTADPRPFTELRNDDGARPPIVIPKPAWGWKILDVIRGRLDAQ